MTWNLDGILSNCLSFLQDIDGLGVAVKGMCKTIKYPEVWKPSLYMFISLALNISTHEGHFYWYTDPTAGPAFSQVGFTIPYLANAKN